MLEADNLECVRGERRLFAGLGFKLEAGELLYLQGRNGAGKTSLLRMIIGLLPPEAGDIRWKGQSIRRSGEDFRADLCYLGHLNAIKEELTPLENLLASAHLTDEALSEDDALDALEQVGLAGREDLACKYLSQGQKRRVALARLLCSGARLWVLDEPFTAIDARTTADLLELVRRWHGESRTVVAVLHDIETVRQAFPQTLLLAREAVASGRATAKVEQFVAATARLKGATP